MRREADAAQEKRDTRALMQALSVLVAVQPNDSGNWLRLSRSILQLSAPNDRERATLLERAATAAYVAYQRAGNRNEEADSLALLSRTFADRKLWRPALDTLRLSLELREVADLRAQYEQLRADHGFRILDYSVDSDAASPRACFQFSEDLPGKRTDLSPFVALGGVDKPALSAEEKQLCIEGLKHGERYAITLRAGLPSSVKEVLTKSADYNIYVRDRKPFVRFTGKAYVLPRSGQQGIPVVSVNTESVNVRILRVGDRNLMSTVLGRDFQRNLDRDDVNRLAEERGVEVWKGDLKVESTLNADVTTAFPVDQAVGQLAPGVYVMVAEPAGPKSEDHESLATQWFIVSDLGLAAYSGNDGVHVFVQSLATTQPKTAVEVRLLARNNELLADAQHRCGRRRALRGRPGARGGRSVAGHGGGRRSGGRLCLPQSQGAGLRSDRPGRRGPTAGVRVGCLRLRRARRLPHRRDRAHHGAVARREGRRRRRRAADDGVRAA